MEKKLHKAEMKNAFVDRDINASVQSATHEISEDNSKFLDVRFFIPTDIHTHTTQYS